MLYTYFILSILICFKTCLPSMYIVELEESSQIDNAVSNDYDIDYKEKPTTIKPSWKPRTTTIKLSQKPTTTTTTTTTTIEPTWKETRPEESTIIETTVEPTKIPTTMISTTIPTTTINTTTPTTTANTTTATTSSPFIDNKCYLEDTKIKFHDLGTNRWNQNEKPLWTIQENGTKLVSTLNTRPSVGVTNLGDPSHSVLFTGRMWTDALTMPDMLGIVFGYQDESNFFVVGATGKPKWYLKYPVNWYVGRVHANCGARGCGSGKTISEAVWYWPEQIFGNNFGPSIFTGIFNSGFGTGLGQAGHFETSGHLGNEDITILARGTNVRQLQHKYKFTVCFNPAKLLINVTVTDENTGIKDLDTGVISAVTNKTDVDAKSRLGGHIGAYVDSMQLSNWDQLECHGCPLI